MPEASREVPLVGTSGRIEESEERNFDRDALERPSNELSKMFRVDEAAASGRGR